MRSIGIGLFCLVLPCKAAAQDVDCYDQAAVASLGQQGLNQCAFVRFADADAELVELFGQVMAGGGGEQMEAAQDLWMSYRELACEAETDGFEDGSMFGLLWMGCMERHTRRRIDDLEQFVALR